MTILEQKLLMFLHPLYQQDIETSSPHCIKEIGQKTKVNILPFTVGWATSLTNSLFITRRDNIRFRMFPVMWPACNTENRRIQLSIK